MSLITIEHGSVASSVTMNNNFEFLDSAISTVASNLTSVSSSIYSSIAGINTALNQANEQLSSDIIDLENYALALRNDFESQNNAPNYDQCIGITLPYTVLQDGYVYAGVEAIDVAKYVRVNGNIVHGHCGYSGGKTVYSGSLFRVSAGDVVTCDNPWGNYYFYPMKG